MTDKAARDFDLVVFGASGFTGKFVTQELAEVVGWEGKTLKWAIAGRSEEKLKKVQEECKLNAAQVPIIIADVNDGDSVEAMCRRTKMLINVVGPYRYWGEPVVEACANSGTDYIDICGEPEFLERVQLKFGPIAKERGSLIVGSCGFDSVPADFGVMVARKQFVSPSVPSKIDTFLSFDTGPKGYAIHFATYEAAVVGVGSQEDLKKVRKEAAATKPKVTRVGPRPALPSGSFVDSRLPNRTCYMFPGADASVIRRTQEFVVQEDNSAEGFHAGCYFSIESGFVNTTKMNLTGATFMTMAQYDIGRRILLKFPYWFSRGLVSHEGPSEDQVKDASFTIMVYAEGYSKKPSPPAEGEEWPPMDKKVVVKVHGPDPGYIGTSRIVVQTALCCFAERSALPAGVFTPGFVLSKTKSATERFAKRGVTFEVLPEEKKEEEKENVETKKEGEPKQE